MERITQQRLERTIALINEAQGLGKRDVGALVLRKELNGYYIMRLNNKGGGGSQLTGYTTPKECMAYLRQYVMSNCLHVNI